MVTSFIALKVKNIFNSLAIIHSLTFQTSYDHEGVRCYTFSIVGVTTAILRHIEKICAVWDFNHSLVNVRLL